MKQQPFSIYCEKFRLALRFVILIQRRDSNLPKSGGFPNRRRLGWLS